MAAFRTIAQSGIVPPRAQSALGAELGFYVGLTVFRFLMFR